MGQSTGATPSRNSTPRDTLPTRAPGTTYPGSSSYRRPTRCPQPSRPTRPFGAPDVGVEIITSNPTDGDDL